MKKKNLWTIAFKSPGMWIFMAALAVRLLYIADSADNPLFYRLPVDSEHYHEQAMRAISGEGLNYHFFMQSAFYPLFLTGVYRAVGVSVLAVKLIQAVLGAALCLLVWLSARRIFDRRTAALAGWMAVFYGPLVFFGGELLGAVWISLWCILLVFLAMGFDDHGGWLRAGGVGLAGGLAVITHPVVLPYFVVLCLWLFGSELYRRIRQGKSSKRFFRRTLPSGAALCLGFAMVTIPVAWGSYRLTGSFSFLPSFGGLNFYIGNMPDSEALNQVRPGMDWEVLVLTPIREGGVRGGVAGEQAWFYQQSLGWLRREPLSFMGNLLGKTPGFFTSREIPNNVNLYLMRRWSAILQVLVWRIGPWGFPFGLLFPLAVVGWVARFRKIPLPVHLFVILFPVAVILVFNSARNRLPITPVVIILAAAGIVSLADWLRRREWKPLLVAGAALTGLVLLTALPGPFPRERIDSEAEMHYILGNYALKERRAEEAANHYLRSLALRPQHGATHMNLGLAMLCAGRDGETARRALERAVALNPQSADARLNLATLYLDLGMRDKALEQYKEALSAHPLLLERDPGVRRMFADD